MLKALTIRPSRRRHTPIFPVKQRRRGLAFRYAYEFEATMNWAKDQYSVTDDLKKMDIQMIHRFLAETYWALGIDQVTVERSIANSISMGVFSKDIQIGFGRVVTDRARFAYLADVFILPEHRGLGLGTWLIDCFLQHPELRDLRLWLLATMDAHEFYSRKGFIPLQEPGRFMEFKR